MLKSMVINGRLPHAMLFTGPEGTGKRLCACAVAASLNCLEPAEGEPCGKCASCTRLACGNQPLVSFVGSLKKEEEIKIETPSGGVLIKNLVPSSSDGEKRTVKLSIKQVQEVIRLASLKGYRDGKKVFIFDDTADASLPAMQSMLKVLEEPPPATYFILVTNREVSLLPTIRSRCQRVEFLPLNRSDMGRFIEERLPRARSAPEAVEAASGSPGRLTRYVNARKVLLSNVPPEDFFSEVSDWISCKDPDEPDLEEKMMMLLEIEAASFRKSPGEENCRRVIIIEDALRDLRKNANADLVVSDMFLKLGAVDLGQVN